ncbi:unnamed protein product, partial [Rotaria sp. Silwood2]
HSSSIQVRSWISLNINDEDCHTNELIEKAQQLCTKKTLGLFVFGQPKNHVFNQSNFDQEQCPNLRQM